MDSLHSLLKRQLRRFAKETNHIAEEQTDFLRAINEAYWQFDEDRRMLENSLELTSQELLEKNAELSSVNTELEQRVAARTIELSRSEARFRGLFEHAPISIWEEDFSAVRQSIDDLRAAGVIDFPAYFDQHPEEVAAYTTQVKIVDVNRATLEMYQAESKAQLLANLSKVMGAESLIPFKAELLALARGETSFENETINYTLRGERRVVSLRLTVAPGYEQTWAKVFVGISDITDRKQAEAALAAERDLLQALMDNIPDTIYFKDTASRFTRINRAQAGVLGVTTPEQAIGKTDLDFFQDPNLAQSFFEEERRMVETGEALINRIEFNPTPDGQPRWFSATKVPIKNADNRVIGIVGVSRNITERKQVEASLAAERDLLQALMDNIPDLIYFKDAASRFTRINRAEAGLLGVVTPEEAIGKTDLDFQNPDLAQNFYEEEQHLVQTGESVINRIEFNPTPDGQPRWFSTTKVPIKDADNRVIGIVGVSRNITLLRQAEDAVRQSEERFKLMAWATRDAVWDWDLQTNQIWWGEGLHKIFHYSSETTEPNPEWRLERIHPEDRAKVNRVIDQALEGGMDFWSKEYRFQRKDGTYAEIMDRGYILQDEAGKPYRMIGAMMDITERKQAEQALLESEARYRQIVETAGDLIYRIDTLGRLTYVNPTALRVLEYSLEQEVLGHDYLEFVHPAWRERVRFAYSAENTLNTYFEFVALTRERREIWLGQTVQIAMENNQVTGFHAVARDITAQKEAEANLHEANYKMGQVLDELQQRNREMVLLNEMSRLLQACQNVEEAYRIITDLSNQLFPQTTGALYLFNTSRTALNAVASWGELPVVEQMIAPNDCWALRHGRTHPLSEDQGGLQCLHLSEPLPAVSYCLPVQIRGEILGILNVRSQHKENLEAAKFQLAYTVVEQAGMTLSNLNLRAALREQSIRDTVTGLYNRRYMEEALKQHLSRVTRHLHPLGILMIDIDHFKSFNDVHGHAAGDRILRELGKFLQSHIRGEDIACRYGGEEFILIMPDVFLEATKNRAEQLRQEAKELRVEDIGQLYAGITLSIGVALYPLHGRTIENVLRAADSALYRAKQEGRDQVVIAETVH
jgi:diguanylate cyclase (GGDEF)-like protein/PAS domain S-box-containing protein